MGPALAGIPIYFLDRFSPTRVLDAIEQRRSSAFIGVPAMYRTLLEAGAADRDLTSVRVWISGADVMPADVARRFKSLRRDRHAAGPGAGRRGGVRRGLRHGRGRRRASRPKVSPPMLPIGLGDSLGLSMPGWKLQGHRRRGPCGAAGPGRRAAAAAAPACSRATGATARRPTRRSPTTAGCAPATWCAPGRSAPCCSRAARRRSSSPAATRCTRSRSRPTWRSTPTCSRPPWSGCPTTSSARCPSRRSGCARAAKVDRRAARGLVRRAHGPVQGAPRGRRGRRAARAPAPARCSATACCRCSIAAADVSEPTAEPRALFVPDGDGVAAHRLLRVARGRRTRCTAGRSPRCSPVSSSGSRRRCRFASTRLTVELLRPVPLAPLVVHTEVVRPGAKVVDRRRAGEHARDGQVLVMARAQRIRSAEVEFPDGVGRVAAGPATPGVGHLGLARCASPSRSTRTPTEHRFVAGHVRRGRTRASTGSGWRSRSCRARSHGVATSSRDRGLLQRHQRRRALRRPVDVHQPGPDRAPVA